MHKSLNNLRNQGQVVIGQVVQYIPDTGQYFVRFPGMAGDSQRGLPARLLSPTPFVDGGGLKSVPLDPIDSPVLLYNAGTVWVIIGFLTPMGAVLNDTHFVTRPTGPGESFMTHNTGSRLGFTNNGSILSWASIWMNQVLNPIKQQFTAYFKSMFINWYGGFVDYTYDDEKHTSTFTLQVKKDVDLAAITPGSVQKDRVTVTTGALDDGAHIAEIEVIQNFDVSKTSHFTSTLQLGKQDDGTWLNVHTTDIDDNSTFDLNSDTTGKSVIILQGMDQTQSIITTLDPTGGTPISIVVDQNKASLTVDSSGNITVFAAQGANIKIGGKGFEQPLVTKAFVEQVYAQHVHSNGNQGAPTGPPLSPPVVDPGTPSNTGPYTSTTLAE